MIMTLALPFKFCHLISIFHTQQLLLLIVCDSPAQMYEQTGVEVEIVVEYSIVIHSTNHYILF